MCHVSPLLFLVGLLGLLGRLLPLLGAHRHDAHAGELLAMAAQLLVALALLELEDQLLLALELGQHLRGDLRGCSLLRIGLDLVAIGNEDDVVRQQLKEAAKECLSIRYIADFDPLNPPEELSDIDDEELNEIMDNATAVSCYLEDKIFVARKVIEKVVFFQQLILRHFDEDEEVSLEETAKLIAQVDDTIPMDVVMLILRAETEEVENALHQD